MKCTAFALLALCLAAPTVRAGDGGDGHVGVEAQAPGVCTFTTATRQLAASNMTVGSAIQAGGQLFISQLTDQVTGRLQPASIQIEILGTCNAPHYVSLSTSYGGLKPVEQQAPVSGTFTQHVNYRAEVYWAGRTIELTTDGTAGQKATTNLIAGPNQGPLTLQFVIDGTGNDMLSPTVAGVYSDLLTVQIGQPL